MKKIGGRITMAELSPHDQKQILALLDFKRTYKKARDKNKEFWHDCKRS